MKNTESPQIGTTQNGLAQEPIARSLYLHWFPFPSRFINRTACFPRKVSYFRESRMSPWKIKVQIRSPSFDRFPKYYTSEACDGLLHTSIFTILQPLESRYHKIKVNDLQDWAWSGETIGANAGITGRLSLRVVLNFVVLHVMGTQRLFSVK